MLYTLSKAVHLVSLFVWIGGMVAVAMSLQHPSLEQVKALKTYDRAVTTPAMILAWVFGLLLAAQGGWFTNVWLFAKLGLVLVLSGLHGALTGRLRRSITASQATPDPKMWLAFPFGLTLVTLIVLLVTTKPF